MDWAWTRAGLACRARLEWLLDLPRSGRGWCSPNLLFSRRTNAAETGGLDGVSDCSAPEPDGSGGVVDRLENRGAELVHDAAGGLVDLVAAVFDGGAGGAASGIRQLAAGTAEKLRLTLRARQERTNKSTDGKGADQRTGRVGGNAAGRALRVAASLFPRGGESGGGAFPSRPVRVSGPVVAPRTLRFARGLGGCGLIVLLGHASLLEAF